MAQLATEESFQESSSETRLILQSWEGEISTLRRHYWAHVALAILTPGAAAWLWLQVSEAASAVLTVETKDGFKLNFSGPLLLGLSSFICYWLLGQAHQLSEEARLRSRKLECYQVAFSDPHDDTPIGVTMAIAEAASTSELHKMLHVTPAELRQRRPPTRQLLLFHGHRMSPLLQQEAEPALPAVRAKRPSWLRRLRLRWRRAWRAWLSPPDDSG